MQECKPSPTPIAIKKTDQPQKSAQPFHDLALYRSLMGSLQFITITRLEIAFAVSRVCQAMHAPSVDDFGAVKRIFRYLNGSKTGGLHFARSDLQLSAFSDSVWAADPCDRKSVTGNVLFLGRNPVLWTSKKQRSVSKSSTEAEYKAMAYTQWISLGYK